MTDSLDITALSFVQLIDKGLLPAVSAVYFVVSPEGEVFYIGATNNLMRRWRNHHRFSQCVGIPGVRIAWSPCTVEQRLEIEREMIHQYAPVLNWSASETGTTTITITQATRDRLRDMGRKEETYDTLLNRIMDGFEAWQKLSPRSSVGAAVEPAKGGE